MRKGVAMAGAMIAMTTLGPLAGVAWGEDGGADAGVDAQSAVPDGGADTALPPERPVVAPPRAPGPEPVVDVVVTGTRTPEQSQRATVKTDVVTRQEAERRGATNVAEALATQPGVQVNPGAYGYLGAVSPIQIQGFDLGRVLILEDGEPVVGDVGGAIDLAALPLSDVERIEIVMGPTSSLYGSSALGGVVNIISGRPRAPGLGSRTRLEGRSHRGLVLQQTLALSRPRAWAVADLSFTRQDGVAEREGVPDLRVPATARALAGLRVGARLGERVDVQARGRWLRQRLDGLESQTYPGLGTYLTESHDLINRFAAQALGTLRPSPGASVRLSGAGQWALRDGRTAPRESPLGETQQTSQTMQSVEAVATVADGPRTWVAGARLELQTARQARQQRRDEGGTILIDQVQELPPRDLSSQALYGQLQWRLGRLTVLPGVRAEHHGGYGGVVAPRLALAVRPSDTLALRASAGRGFRTPSAKELGFNFDHSIYGYRVVGNPDLVPERSWGVNADVAWAPSASVALRAGGFANWVDQLIDIDLASGSTSGTVVTYSYANFAKVRTFGAQVGATARVGQRLRFDAAYDQLWTRDVVEGTPLPGRPPRTFTASAQASLPWRLEATARVRLVSAAYVDVDTRSPGYDTVDVRVARALWAGVQLYAGVLNARDVHQEAGRIGDLRPPLGRVFYAGVRAELPGEGN